MRLGKANVFPAMLAGTTLLLCAGVASAATFTVNLTATRQMALMPDGENVPMWGWVCGTGAAAPSVGATCGALNPVTQGAVPQGGTPATGATTGTVWQPPLITIPTGNGLTINLTNNLPVETSLTIVGQLGGGLGSPVREAVPRSHPGQGATTWVSVLQGAATSPFIPPTQIARARSFVPEAAAATTSCTGTPPVCTTTAGTQTYTWPSLNPGTYLIRTGTYPSIQGPMGLYGVLVVTTAPVAGTGTAAGTAGTAYPNPTGATLPGVQYDADASLVLSEIDPLQNRSVDAIFPGGPNNIVNPNFASFKETTNWTPACGAQGPTLTANTCYPPAVDYTPLYYLINGVAFDKTRPGLSALAPGSTTTCTTSTTTPPVTTCSTTYTTPYTTGNVLLRFVNAGSRMHMPSVIGTPMKFIAEDGNLQPDVIVALSQTAHTVGTPKTTTDAFMPAGKTLDILLAPANNATTAATGYSASTYPVFDRELGTTANAIHQDAGMLGYLLINGGGGVGGVAGAGSFNPQGFSNGVATTAATAVANPDNYIIPAHATTFAGNVLANDVGVRNASSPCLTGGSTAPQTIATSAGTVTLNPDGSFTLAVTAGFSPSTATPPPSGTFTYCGNGNSSAATTATVTFTAAKQGGAPTAVNDVYTSNASSLFTMPSPGVLLNDTDPNNYPLTAAISGAASGCTVTLNKDGSFAASKASSTTAATCTFGYTAMNSQGTMSNVATVTINFPAANTVVWNVLDAGDRKTAITDYKWRIERDLTFQVDPNQVPLTATGAPCPAGQTCVTPSLATNFHATDMPMIANGCTGPVSCQQGQTVFDPVTKLHCPATCVNGICTPIMIGTGAAATCGTAPATAGAYAPSLPNDVNLPVIDTTGTACTTTTFTGPANSPAGCNPNYGKLIHYYLSILPGDAALANPSVPNSGHTLGGGPIIPVCTTRSLAPGDSTVADCPNAAAGASGWALPTSWTQFIQDSPVPTAMLTIHVFQDDNELNGEIDAEQNVEGGLGGFEIELWDDAGATGDATGQMTYDMFNMPLENALNGMIDPTTGINACPISPSSRIGTIVVCPNLEADGKTPSPLAGSAIVAHLMPGRFGVIAHPGAQREAAGEEWVTTSTLDGTHFQDAFVKMGEPAYFQEYGPAGYHVFIGEANPAIINNQLKNVCAGVLTFDGVLTADGIDSSPNKLVCNNTIRGQITNLHISRPPDERLYDSGVDPTVNPDGTRNAVNRLPFAQTQCFVSLGVWDSPDIGFAKCDANGNFVFTGIPDGAYSVTVFDEWLDQLIFEKLETVKGGQTLDIGTYPVFSWQTHAWNSVYMDLNQDGIQQANEPGLIQVPVRVRFRDGSFSNTLLTDVSGRATFNEVTPLFNWFTIESDTTRFRGTGVHVVYDSGGQVDGSTASSTNPLANFPFAGLINSNELWPITQALAIPGSIYCGVGDPLCKNTNFSNPAYANGYAGLLPASPPPPLAPGATPTPLMSTGRIDAGRTHTEGFQAFAGMTAFFDWGKIPYEVGENGGITGHVVHASTRPFDDPTLLFQNLWEPLVANVTVNLYQEVPAPDGTVALKLVDTTKSSSWDAWAQSVRPGTTTPNMSCPGQDPADPFFNYTLGTSNRYKCYDGMHNFDQIQPAPYDGLWQFPSANCLAASATGGANTFTVPVTNQSGTTQTQTITCVTVPNPALKITPHTGAAPRVLPPGKYVVEVVPPPGYEIVKEEDKNILNGDAFQSYASQQFNGITDIYIVPDQASLNFYNPSYTGPSGATYNPMTQNNGNPTTNMGRTSVGGFGPGGLIVMPSPCIGQMRVVPDYMSIAPQSGVVSPFAGDTRPLCDRREVTLEDQMQAQTDFFIFTQTPGTTKFTGFILDDLSSEFDANSPDFGEKFAVPQLPVSVKDFAGNETARLYSDQWGIFNGLVFSTWQVNPPNPTGYSPGMMVFCMNDPGPIVAPVCSTPPSAGTPGFPPGCVTAQTTPPIMIPDPAFNRNYTDFCYEVPFMPGRTAYLDTPVVPVAAFAEGYNPPDCELPDTTPRIRSVIGDTGLATTPTSGSSTCPAAGCGGPWVSAAGNTLTINALGDYQVPNPAYSGPAATAFAGGSVYGQKFITRHYGFGTSPTVTIGGIATSCGGNDLTLTCTVPSGLPACPRQQAGYGGNLPPGATTTLPPALCGELVITAANGQRSVDTATVTVGGKQPTYVAGENLNNRAVQDAIDAAIPGDLIIVGPGTYPEILLMWKPVRLQGVGAASVTIDSNAHPAGKLDQWRAQVDCLFGLSSNSAAFTGSNTTPNPVAGQPPILHQVGTNPYLLPGPVGNYPGCTLYNNPTTGAAPTAPVNSQVDPLPDENILGWGLTEGGGQLVNGNLGEVLIEPTLMGALEGATITVLGADTDRTVSGAAGHLGCQSASNIAPSGRQASNFNCNPSIIDGLTLINSQAGGGIFAHGWNHHLEISNNAIRNNGGTVAGGISIGQLEVPPVTIVNGRAAAYHFDDNVHMHHNEVIDNVSFGDEFNTDTNAAGGGMSILGGSDGYRVRYNWVCGNLSTGDGGGISHYGLSYNGQISHNTVIFNQSFNQTLPTRGGGISIQGEPQGPACEGPPVDIGCPAQLSDGVGANLVVDSNLVMGNLAEGGAGGGISLQDVNGTDVQGNPNTPGQWWQVTLQDNIIVNNMAGYGGGGIALYNTANSQIVHNTIASNDSTASAGVLFDTIGSNQGSIPTPSAGACNGNTVQQPMCGVANPVTTSNFQPAGVLSAPHGPLFLQVFGRVCSATVTTNCLTCPANQPNCNQFSSPLLDHNIFWQNRSFHITASGTQYTTTPPNAPLIPPGGTQNIVALVPVINQASTAVCGSGANYWDLGVAGDSQPQNATTGAATGAPASTNPGCGNTATGTAGCVLHPINSDMTSTAGYTYTGGNNVSSNPGFPAQYCNGSRVPPEIVASICANNANAPGCSGASGGQITVPPGIPDIDPMYPLFILNPAATVDEGNNWINLRYGPLSVTSPAAHPAAPYGYNTLSPWLGNYFVPGPATNPGVRLGPFGLAPGK